MAIVKRLTTYCRQFKGSDVLPYLVGILLQRPKKKLDIVAAIHGPALSISSCHANNSFMSDCYHWIIQSPPLW
jgi:hypothetical protein